MICNTCEGAGKLGFQREVCSTCLGSGYIKEKIKLNKYDVEEGFDLLIKRQLEIMEKLNTSCDVFTEDGCNDMLKLLREKNHNDYILKYLFNIEKYVYTKNDFDGVTIV